jgi:hypothetical protein
MYAEIAQHTDEFKKVLETEFGTEVKYQAPMQIAPGVTVDKNDFIFSSDKGKFYVIVNNNGISIEFRESVIEDTIMNIQYFREVSLRIWNLLNNIIDSHSIVKIGVLIVLHNNTIEPEAKQRLMKSFGDFKYETFRVYNSDDIKIKDNANTIRVFENVFFEYNEDRGTLLPVSSRASIDIAVPPKTNGLVGKGSVDEIHGIFFEKLLAIYSKVF